MDAFGAPVEAVDEAVGCSVIEELAKERPDVCEVLAKGRFDASEGLAKERLDVCEVLTTVADLVLEDTNWKGEPIWMGEPTSRPLMTEANTSNEKNVWALDVPKTGIFRRV